MNYWITADTHFNHANIIRYCNRPFNSIEEMNEVLIYNWNAVVKPGDVVYHLGDFGFGRAKGINCTEDVKNLLKRLNGCINLILGNHDEQNFNSKTKGLFQSTALMRDVTINNQRIVLCHYAMRTWPGSNRGSWQLYGHSHGKLLDDPNLLSIDVGVDCHNFRPINFDEIKVIMSKKTWKPFENREDESD